MSRTGKGVLALLLIGVSAGLVGFVGDVSHVTELQIESAIRARLAADSPRIFRSRQHQAW